MHACALKADNTGKVCALSARCLIISAVLGRDFCSLKPRKFDCCLRVLPSTAKWLESAILSTPRRNCGRLSLLACTQRVVSASTARLNVAQLLLTCSIHQFIIRFWQERVRRIQCLLRALWWHSATVLLPTWQPAQEVSRHIQVCAVTVAVSEA